MEQPVPKREPTSYGPFQVVRKIGSGGMGTVFEARHEMLGLSVAIKTIGGNVSLTEETRARFLREARAAAKVRHQNVAQIYDIGSQDGVPYMVLELLRGQTLAALLEREGRLPAERAADLLVPAIAGVAAAHECAIVHRDLKPHNVFISEERGGPVPRVLDFGISKLVDDAASVLTRSDVLLGTAQYMSPEQARGSKHVDARSDQYSLGAVLYECVTGLRAFEADNIYGLVHRIVEGQFEPPSRICSEVTAELEAVILKAMSLEPNDRYSTTASFGLALLPFATPKSQLVYADELRRSLSQAHQSATRSDTAANGISASANASASAEAASGERLSASVVKARRELALGSTVGEVTPPAQAHEARTNLTGMLVVLAIVGMLVVYIVGLQNEPPSVRVDTVPTGQPSVESPVVTADVETSLPTRASGVSASPSSPRPSALASSHATALATSENSTRPANSGAGVSRTPASTSSAAQRVASQAAEGGTPSKPGASMTGRSPTATPHASQAPSPPALAPALASSPSPSSFPPAPKPNRATKHGLVQQSPF